MEVREATQADVHEILSLMHQCYLETGMQDKYRYQEEHVTAVMLAAVNNPGALVLVVEDETGVFGVIFGTMDLLWYRAEYVMNQQFVFIRERSRGTTACLRLLRAFEAAAIAMECSAINFGHALDVTAKLNSTLRAMGYTDVGTLFYKEV